MHAAPSVSYPVGRSAFAAMLLVLLAAVGLAAVLAFTLQSAALGWRQAAGWTALVAASLFAGMAWRRSASGVLHWDGVSWQWEEGGAMGTGRPEIALDLQSRLLLRWCPEGGSARWFWLERASAPSHWDALRRAVYSRSSLPVPQTGPPPAAEQ